MLPVGNIRKRVSAHEPNSCVNTKIGIRFRSICAVLFGFLAEYADARESAFQFLRVSFRIRVIQCSLEEP